MQKIDLVFPIGPEFEQEFKPEFEPEFPTLWSTTQKRAGEPDPLAHKKLVVDVLFIHFAEILDHVLVLAFG